MSHPKGLKLLKLSKFGKYAIVDEEDNELVSKFNWQYVKGYARCQMHMGTINGKKIRTNLYLHNMIMRSKIGMEIDHRNLNKLDCRKQNMRVCTHAENCRNVLKRKNGSSQFKGVSWYKAYGLWNAQLSKKRKRKCLGYYKSEIEAARAYDRAALKYFGEYSRKNFPKEDYAYA